MGIGLKRIWNDAGLLREELSSIYYLHVHGDQIFLSPYYSKYTEKLITRISKLTNISKEEIRTAALKEAKSN